jgi:hypothetical protein
MGCSSSGGGAVDFVCGACGQSWDGPRVQSRVSGKRSPFNPKLKVQHVLVDQSMAILSFLSPYLQSAFRYTLKRIKIVKINSVQVVNGRIDITRYRQIDYEEWSMPSRTQ